MSRNQKKTRDDVFNMTDEEFKSMVMQLESCEEAAQIFDEMIICPVCSAVVNSRGVLYHKDPKIFKCN